MNKFWTISVLSLALGTGVLMKTDLRATQPKETSMEQPIDFYNLIHKALRRELFTLGIDIGTTNFKDTTQVHALLQRLTHVISILRHHGEHEDKYFHSFLKTKTPDVLAILDQQHTALEVVLKQLETLRDTISTSKNDQERALHGQNLYQLFNLFIAHYLTHLSAEEHNMPLIRERSTMQEMEKVVSDFQAKADPKVLEDTLYYMFPALSEEESQDLLLDIQQNAPPEVYQRVLKIYETSTESLKKAG